MPTNKFFKGFDRLNEQKLYKDLINEVTKFFGIDAIYIPRTSLSQPDALFGDDPTKAFSGAYPMAMYIENVDGFEGGDLFTKFGYVINKQLRLLLANQEFQQATTGTLGSRAREGDIVWMPNFQALYEIKHVNQDKFFYAFGSRPFYGWELVCEEFRYNNEMITTGISEIDSKVDSIITIYAAKVSSGNVTFNLADVVYQGSNLSTSTASANVVSWNRPTGTLVLSGIVGDFVANQNVHGSISGANWILNSIEDQEDLNRPIDNNIQIRTEANTDLDLSESNPIQGNPITYSGQE